jgi:hypothetical protein
MTEYCMGSWGLLCLVSPSAMLEDVPVETLFLAAVSGNTIVCVPMLTKQDHRKM